jgi:hypothetical protein
MPGYFAPGTPLYTEEGGDIFEGPRKLDAAKRLLAEDHNRARAIDASVSSMSSAALSSRRANAMQASGVRWRAFMIAPSRFRS